MEADRTFQYFFDERMVSQRADGESVERMVERMVSAEGCVKRNERMVSGWCFLVKALA